MLRWGEIKDCSGSRLNPSGKSGKVIVASTCCIRKCRFYSSHPI
jgi:hypothetical protein